MFAALSSCINNVDASTFLFNHTRHVKPTSAGASVLSTCAPPAAAAALPCCCGPALLLRPCPAAAALPCCLPIVHLRFVNVFRALSPFQRSSSCLTGHQPGALRTKRMFARDPQARCRTPKRMLSLIPRVSWASARPLASPSAMK